MSMWSVAKFLTATRRTGSWRVSSSDSVTLAGGDKEVDKIPSPPPAPVASEVVPEKPEPQPTEAEVSPPQSTSRTQSEVASPEPTEDSTAKPSTWTGDENESVVREPEESQSLETKVESNAPSKAPSERRDSAFSNLQDGNEHQTSKGVEPTNLEQNDDEPEKLPVETSGVPEPETISVEATPEKEGPVDDSHGLQEELRDAVDNKTEAIKPLSDEVDRLEEDTGDVTLGQEDAPKNAEVESVEMGPERMKAEMEDIRRASKENEEAAKKETQRVKALIAVERHSRSERMKELEQEKEELIAALEAAKRETQRVKALIAVERHSHSERVKELEQGKDELSVALEAARKETQRVKALIAVERHSHSDRVMELEQGKDALISALEDAKKETQRVKGIIAVQRHSHNERAKEFKQEKEELLSALESAQSDILASAAETESQREQIRGLEGGLEDSREETRELYNKYHEQESTIKRLQEIIAEECDKVLMKDKQMQSQKAVTQSLSTSLVELQSKANKTERHNRMLLEQVRQQSDELQNRQYMDSYAGLGRFMAANTLSAFSSLTRGIRRGAVTARADSGLKTLKELNDEIFQLAASLTDQLESEGFDKRFVTDDSLSLFSGSERHEATAVRRVKAEYLKSTLGLELINRLEKDAPYPMRDTNPFYVQVALQGCLTACCMRIITSWYPNEWEYGRFLEVLYDRIRGTGGLDAALNWRKTTQQNCVPSTPRDRNSKLVDYLKDDLRTVLSVSGWSSESDADVILENLREKLFNLVSLALRLNTMTASGVPGELEPILAERGSVFDWREMGDDCAADRSRKADLIPKEETVICAVGLGLKWSEGSDVDLPRLLLKPRVVLDSAILV